MDEQQFFEITPDTLKKKVQKLKKDGFRLVVISCTCKDSYELTYSFDREFQFIHLRFIANKETEVESISDIFGYAFLYENEIRDLFGVKIINIPVDFEGKLYRIKQETPFCNLKVSEEVTE